MSIETKLKLLEDETKQLRLELMIKDLVQYDYWQLNILRQQIDNRMEELKQDQDDMKQDQDRQAQLKLIEVQALQIQQTKDRAKRPRLRVERTGEIIMRKTDKK